MNLDIRDDVPMLDPDVIDIIGAGHRPADSSAFDAVRIERVRARLFAAKAEAKPQQLSVTTFAKDTEWSPYMRGVEIRILYRDEARCAYLLKLAPNTVIPEHPHEMDEECLVLEGELEIDGELRLSAGDYHVARAGHFHHSIRSVGGATLMLRGAPPL